MLLQVFILRRAYGAIIFCTYIKVIVGTIYSKSSKDITKKTLTELSLLIIINVK